MDLVFLAMPSMFKVVSAIRIHGRDVARVQGTRDQIIVCAVTYIACSTTCSSAVSGGELFQHSLKRVQVPEIERGSVAIRKIFLHQSRRKSRLSFIVPYLQHPMCQNMGALFLSQ